MNIRKVMYGVGWALLVLAFVAAASETGVRARGEATGALVPARVLWEHFFAGSLITFEVFINETIPWAWDPGIRTVLILPAWVLLSLPGGLVLWKTWPQKTYSETELAELHEQEETMLLFDKLAKDADDAGFNDDPEEDDRLPSHAYVGKADGEGYGFDDGGWARETADGTLEFEVGEQPNAEPFDPDQPDAVPEK